jgi:RNA polymerase I-specific transcription initiation factor RRN3
MQFARVAQATDFLYCFSILEANKRLSIQPGQQLDVSTELNTFFPFDPYRLPRSGEYIHDIYREWSTVAIGDDEDEDEEEDEDGEEAVEEGNTDHNEHRSSSLAPSSQPFLQIPQLAPTANEDDEGLGESFGGMSISPAHPSIMV